MNYSNNLLESLEFTKTLGFIAKYAFTEYGKELINNLRPLNDISEIKKHGGFVTEAKAILIDEEIPPISYLPDLRESLAQSKVEGAVLNQKVIIDVLSLAQISSKLLQFFNKLETETTLSIEYKDRLFYDKSFEYQFKNIFTETGDISDGASIKLKEIRRSIIEKEDSLRKSVERILKKLSSSYLVQEEYITMRDGRTVLPIKAEHKRHVKGFIHSESASGQTVYIEPEETLELNNDILSLKFAEKREIERILKELTKRIGEASPKLRESFLSVSELDLIFSIANYSIEIIGAFPSVDESKPFDIIQGRHPLLLNKLGREKTIPLNLLIDENNVVVITGPNAGGKTVVLKTVGLLTLLVNSGIHIPAEADSNFPVIKNLLMDIGDKQSIEDDLSTFSSHLTNINSILNEAGKKSLVLIDEIGTGTDPEEGSALATAILIELQRIGAKVLATTHHGNLKILANELKGFENASMEFDPDKLLPTYHFKQGMPGSSYAFEVAKRIGLDETILNLAKENLQSDKYKLEKFLVEIEKKSNELNIKLREMEKDNVRLKGLSNLYKDKVDKLEKQKNDIIKKAKDDAKVYLQDVNKKVEKAIKEIRESNADKDVIKKQREILNNVKEESITSEKEISSNTSEALEITEGSYARIKDSSTEGIVSDIDKNKNKAILTAGAIKIQVKISNLEPVKKIKKESNPYQKESYTLPTLNSIRLDIRGQKAEEAEMELINFLDEAYSSGAGQVEVLHGKGTGVLKRTVHEILKKNDFVKKFYFANIEVGGDGITIVELK